MYKVKQFGSGSEPAGCLSKQQQSNQARFKAATAKKIHLQDPLFYENSPRLLKNSREYLPEKAICLGMGPTSSMTWAR